MGSMIRLINRWIQQQLVSMIHDRFPHKRGREHEVPYDAYHPCGERTHPLGRISQTFFLDERARCRHRAIHMSMETYISRRDIPLTRTVFRYCYMCPYYFGDNRLWTTSGGVLSHPSYHTGDRVPAINFPGYIHTWSTAP